MEATPGARRTRSRSHDARTRSIEAARGRRADRGRRRASRSGSGCASRGRSSRSSSRSSSSLFFLYLNRDRARRRSRSSSSRRTRRWSCSPFVVFYLGFPLRGYRWTLLLRGTGFVISVRDSTEIIFISWLVNCLVPAKLGDVYRAYLLKINSPASLSRTFGTVFIERILDLFAIAILGLAAGFWSFRTACRPAIQVVFVVGVVRRRARRHRAVHDAQLRPADPRAAAAAAPVLELYDRFEEGVFGALGLQATCRSWRSSPGSSGRPRRCACSSSSRRSASPTSSSGFRARSSWRSSARC